MREEFDLFRKDTSRVTYAAVFIPFADNPDQDIKYLLPEGIREASGFGTYKSEEHHRDSRKGTLCCGNCYEQGKLVPVFHRGKTDERVGGGDKEGTHATWSAYPHTIDEHTEDCRERRTASGRAEQSQHIRWNINIPETYQGAVAPEAVNPADPLLAKRAAKVIHHDMQEILAIAGRLTHQQVQDSVYVVSGRPTPHRHMFIDGDNWKRMVRHNRQNAYTDSLYRLFHINIPTSKNIRHFADAVAHEPTTTKIPCARYSFKDERGTVHVIQPSIEASRDDVRAIFEKTGDYLVLGPSAHNPKRVGKAVIVHELTLYVTSPALVAELYKDPSRKVGDYNALHNLQIESHEVHLIEPKVRANPGRKTASVHPAQQPLVFSDVPDTSFPAQNPH